MDLSRRTVLGQMGAAALGGILLPWKPKPEDLLVPGEVACACEPVRSETIIVGPEFFRGDQVQPALFRLTLLAGQQFHYCLAPWEFVSEVHVERVESTVKLIIFGRAYPHPSWRDIISEREARARG